MKKNFDLYDSGLREAGLKAAGKSADFHHYDADHGFMNEQRPVHDRAHGDTAWGRMLDFWRQHIG